jgi:hypothetical protein
VSTESLNVRIRPSRRMESHVDVPTSGAVAVSTSTSTAPSDRYGLENIGGPDLCDVDLGNGVKIPSARALRVTRAVG